ncbi:hypothetical protein ACLOJK_034570 [Asimina triloba]
MGEAGDSFDDAAAAAGTPLSTIANAFEDLAGSIPPDDSDSTLNLSQFLSACSLVSVLFGFLGFAFKFAELEYVSKVQDLMEASKTYNTLNDILDHDVHQKTVRQPGSRTRNLRRVRQGLDLVRALFEEFLSTKWPEMDKAYCGPGWALRQSACSLKDAASKAYEQVCAPYHSWAIRKAVGAGMYALPTREQLLLRLNENDNTVEKAMRRYITASSPVIAYIDKLYMSRDITLDCELATSAAYFLLFGRRRAALVLSLWKSSNPNPWLLTLFTPFGFFIWMAISFL